MVYGPGSANGFPTAGGGWLPPYGSPPVARNYYGVIVYSLRAKCFTWASGQDTGEHAWWAALGRLPEHNDTFPKQEDLPRQLAWGRNTWLALAVSGDGSSYGIGWNTNPKHARKAALRKCPAAGARVVLLFSTSRPGGGMMQVTPLALDFTTPHCG